MDPSTTSNRATHPAPPAHPTTRFGEALRERPLRASAGLGVEYAMFASGLGLALCLFASRVPLRIADRLFGLRLRDRFVDLLARVSPG